MGNGLLPFGQLLGEIGIMNETLLNPSPPVGVYYGPAFFPPSLYDHALLQMLSDITQSNDILQVGIH